MISRRLMLAAGTTIVALSPDIGQDKPLAGVELKVAMIIAPEAVHAFATDRMAL